MTTGHPLVVEARKDAWVSTAEYVPDGDITLDPRDQTLTQTLINSEIIPGADVVLALGRSVPGEYHIRHHHPYGSETYYVTKGELTVYLDGEEFVLRQGQGLFIPPGGVHATRNHTDAVCEMVVVCGGPTYASLGLVYDE